MTVIKRSWSGAVTLLVVLVVSSLLANAGTQYATGCPPQEQECEYVGRDCVDWDSSPACTLTAIVACAAACAGGGWYGGFSCGVGCGLIAWELCKFCEEWEYNRACHCPGTDPPEFAVPPVVLDPKIPLIPAR